MTKCTNRTIIVLKEQLGEFIHDLDASKFTYNITSDGGDFFEILIEEWRDVLSND